MSNAYIFEITKLISSYLSYFRQDNIILLLRLFFIHSLAVPPMCTLYLDHIPLLFFSYNPLATWSSPNTVPFYSRVVPHHFKLLQIYGNFKMCLGKCSLPNSFIKHFPRASGLLYKMNTCAVIF